MRFGGALIASKGLGAQPYAAKALAQDAFDHGIARMLLHGQWAARIAPVKQLLMGDFALASGAGKEQVALLVKGEGIGALHEQRGRGLAIFGIESGRRRSACR